MMIESVKLCFGVECGLYSSTDPETQIRYTTGKTEYNILHAFLNFPKVKSFSP